MTTTTASNKVCAIFGFGQGIGAAVARKYSKEGYKVAIISRSIDKLQTYEKTIPNSKGFACDVTKPDVINSTVDLIEKEFNNPIDVLVWNAGGGVWKSWDKIDIDSFDMAMKTNVYGLLCATQKIAPGMIERINDNKQSSQCSILVTGATASLRGKPFTAGFAPQKGAQRLLTQSLARDLGPKGIHVGLFIIDGQVGKIDVDDPKKIDPDAIADTYWSVANQPSTCWSFETEVRPSLENW